MGAAKQERETRKHELLTELSELMIEEQVEEGVFLGTPHFSVIETAALKLGDELSREAQQRGSREVAANCSRQAACPDCQTLCPVEVKNRDVTSLSGTIEIAESNCRCPKCRRSFFPSTRRNGDG